MMCRETRESHFRLICLEISCCPCCSTVLCHVGFHGKWKANLDVLGVPLIYLRFPSEFLLSHPPPRLKPRVARDPGCILILVLPPSSLYLLQPFLFTFSQWRKGSFFYLGLEVPFLISSSFFTYINIKTAFWVDQDWYILGIFTKRET